MDRCAALGCSTEVAVDGGEFSFFPIPTDPEMKNSWEAKLGQTDLSQSSVICEKHFSSQDLNCDENGGTTLKPDAVPTMFDVKNILEGDTPVRRSNRKRAAKKRGASRAGSETKSKLRKGPSGTRQLFQTEPTSPQSKKRRKSSKHEEDIPNTKPKLVAQRSPGRGRKKEKKCETSSKSSEKIKLIGDDERGHAIADWYLVDIFEATRVITSVLQRGTLVTDNLVANMEETIIEMMSKLLQRLSSVLITTIEEEFKIKCSIMGILKNLHENIKENLNQLAKDETDLNEETGLKEETGLNKETDLSQTQVKSEEDSYEEAVWRLDYKEPISIVEEVISSPFDEDCVVLEHSYSRPFEQETEKIKKQKTGDVLKIKSKLQCGFCSFKTFWKSKLRCHIKNHLQRKSYDCTLCEYSAGSNEAYQKHFRTHTGEKPYCCSDCDFRTANKSNLIRHKVIHTGLKPYACPYCEHTTRQKGSLDVHIATHSKTPKEKSKSNNSVYVCGECNFVTVHKSELNTHAKTHMKFNCSHCEFVGSDLKELRDHQVVHNGLPHICKQCNRSYKTANELRVHLEIHNIKGDELVCSVCNYKTTRMPYFKRHVAAHWGEKPFKCNVCQNTFRLQSHLTMHLRKHEIGPHCKRSSM